MTAKYQVAGIGNAVVDVLSQVSDETLHMLDIEKGIMTLVDRERAERLYGAMEGRVQQPGGSVANTVAGCGALGLKTAFIGRVADDGLGHDYIKGMAADGTDFVNAPVAGAEAPTSRSMIFVSPDGERSMNTYLGTSADLGPDDVPADVAAGAEILFLEGYLFDKDAGKAAFLSAAQACGGAGGRPGISLSDPFCVNRHRADFQRLVSQDMAYVIGNSHEWTALYETADLDAALAEAGAACDLVVCTRSGDPVVILDRGQRIEVPVSPVTPVDATGAGDQFAAGFLFGLAHGRDLEICGRMGVIAAAEVIGHMGPRPATSIRDLFVADGLI